MKLNIHYAAAFALAVSSLSTHVMSDTNAEIEEAADAIIDFTEGNPFGSL